SGELKQAFTVPPEMAGFTWEAELWAALGSDASFTVPGPSGQVAVGVVAEVGHARPAGLSRPPGDYSLPVTAADSVPTTARYQLEAAGRLLNGAAVEPNDDWSQAGLVRPGDSVTGTLAGSDYYRLEIDDAQAAGAWDVSLDSEQA